MNHHFLLKKEHLVPLLRKLAKDSRLIAPIRNDYGDTLFSEIDDLSSVTIDMEKQAQNPLKQFFFPQTEKLSSYTLTDHPQTGRSIYKFQPHLPENKPTVYVGVRACDMHAILYLDRIFAHDPHYQQRRRNATFITLGYHTPSANCFCHDTNTGPFLTQNYDLQLTDIGDNFFVELGSDEGEAVLDRWPVFFNPATQQHRLDKHQVELDARSCFNLSVKVDKAVTLLAQQPLPAAVLSKLAIRCQGCAGCAYVCPTCSCFNISDQALGADCGERRRSWDACTFSGFTRMAGDHNPVDGEKDRATKRFLHKLKHDVERYGQISCVGCGRCVDMCFGGVDIVAFINILCETEK
ncbi:MAG: 4Fe-4S dicluster domain-containing protein [Thermodesulfobacteriota bacterium]|nr:4Fe-4S dicluster domain-containing protein [Thermodesulfobacteriota bacterium]